MFVSLSTPMGNIKNKIYLEPKLPLTLLYYKKSVLLLPYVQKLLQSSTSVNRGICIPIAAIYPKSTTFHRTKITPITIHTLNYFIIGRLAYF
jgi:hypothetical protein